MIRPAASASEITTVWRFRNSIIIIIIMFPGDSFLERLVKDLEPLTSGPAAGCIIIIADMYV